MQGALGHAVEGEQQHLGHEGQRLQLARHIAGQRRDMGRIVVIGRQGADCGLPAHRGQRRPTASITLAVVAPEYCG
jgi:hypothetical protein